jgi:cobalt-precorrin 5A hydrolase/precorrin-3B C17-methyltransferase
VIGLFAATEAGRRAAADLAAFLGPDVVVPDGPVRPALHRLWPQLGAAVLFLPTEAAVRLVAPLLRDRQADPAVICVDDAGAFAVALVGDGGALTDRIAELRGSVPVVTRGAERTPLDDLVELLDASVDGDAEGCGAALASGEPVVLANPLGFPLPALPDNVVLSASGAPARGVWTVVVDDRRPDGPDREGRVRLVPRTLVVGLGSRRGVTTTAVASALSELELRGGLDLRAVRAFATSENKADERGIVEAVEDWGFWHDDTTAPLLTYPAASLAVVDVPNPSSAVLAEVGTASVAEAAALHGAMALASGARVEMAAEKFTGDRVTVAAARILPRGRLAVIGLGPGAADLRTPRAEAELRRASTVVGVPECLEQVRHLLRPGTRITAGDADTAVRLASEGAAVALVSAGAGTALDTGGLRVELVEVPGVA